MFAFTHGDWPTGSKVNLTVQHAQVSCRADTKSHKSGGFCASLRLLAGKTSVALFDDVVGVLGVARADCLLVELADAGQRHRLDERPALGQPPANHLVA